MSGTAVQHVEAHDLEARKHLNRVLVTADQMAAATLVLRSDLRNKVQDVRAIALTLDQHGLPITIQNVNACFVVNGAVEFMTRLWTGLAMARGHHRVWVCDADPAKCDCSSPSSATEGRAHIQRGDDGMTYTATFSWDQAKTAGLTDSATYKKYPQDMLGWRALSRVVKRYAPDIVIGVGEAASDTVAVARPRPPAFDPMPAQDDDVTDAEIVEPEQGEDPGITVDQVALLERERARMAEPGYRETLEQPPAAVDPEEVYATRRRRANAVMGEVGVKTDDGRHELVGTATGGATRSTGSLTAWQVEAIVAFCDRLKAAETDESGGEVDNVGAAVVGASTAPPSSGPVIDQIKAMAKAKGVTQADLLRKAQEFAAARGLPAPAALSQLDELTESDLADWLGEA